jgi:hypothetical protein
MQHSSELKATICQGRGSARTRCTHELHETNAASPRHSHGPREPDFYFQSYIIIQRPRHSFRRPLHLNAFNFASGHSRWVAALTRPLGEVIRNFYVIQGFDIGLIEDCDLSQLSRRAGRLARSTGVPS